MFRSTGSISANRPPRLHVRATSSIRQPTTPGSTTLPAEHVRTAGFFCGWPVGVWNSLPDYSTDSYVDRQHLDIVCNVQSIRDSTKMRCINLLLTLTWDVERDGDCSVVLRRVVYAPSSYGLLPSCGAFSSLQVACTSTTLFAVSTFPPAPITTNFTSSSIA